MDNRSTAQEDVTTGRGLTRLRRPVLAIMLGLAALALVRPAAQAVEKTGGPALSQSLPALAAAAAPATISGMVFEDKDGDGERDANEQGVPHVSVSDGKTIVQTDQQGRYSLTTDPDRRVTDIVFVTYLLNKSG